MLIVDDSAVVRQTLEKILSSDDAIEVMATAPDPFIAAEKIRLEVPDVITLDIEIPRMDGVTFLHKIMSPHPIPVVICSSLTSKGCETTLKAFEYGAVEIIEKPRLGAVRFLHENKTLICDTARAASLACLRKIPATRLRASQKLTADAIIAKSSIKAMIKTTEKVAGAVNIAQDEATSIVFGMPNEVIKRGGVDKVLPLEAIAEEVVRLCET